MAARRQKKQKTGIRLYGWELAYQIVISIIVILVLIICIVPLLYVLGMSFTSQGEMIERHYFVIIPRRPIVTAYTYVFKQGFLHGLLVTVARTALGVIAALLLAVPTGYALATKDLPYKFAFMVFFIITMVLSGGLIPDYMLMNKLHLLNSFWVYIIPGFANTYGILVTKLFVEGVPDDVFDSAELDGASQWQKFQYIALPLLRPTTCALGLFAAVIHWNSWFDAMVYNSGNKSLYPVQLLIRNLLSSDQSGDILNNISTYARMTPQSIKMASVIVALLPILCVYPFLQKYFISGVYTGAVKG